ncbi:MAG TPA: protein-S-isoprenylcysteine O-methyltransferase [Candidatus Methanoperedens sp.]
MLDNYFEILYLIGLITGSLIRAKYVGRKNWSSFQVVEKLLLAVVSIGMLLIPVIYLATPWLDLADYHLPLWAGWIGVAVFSIALWLLFRSHADLGRNFSPTLEIKEGQTLVTCGVYSRIRHPMYAAHWLWAVSQVLLLQNWIAGPAFLVTFLPMYLYRVPREEQMMIKNFKDEYRSYMKRTGRIIPRFW